MTAKSLVAVLLFLLLILSGNGYGGTEGSSNTLYGNGAGSNLGDDDNFATFIGYQAGYNTNDGTETWHGKNNTFAGYNAGYTNTTGYHNTFLGMQAGYSNTTGYENTFLGRSAGYRNNTGYHNTFLGRDAGYSNTTGGENTFLGKAAGYNATGSNNVFIGCNAGYNETGSNKLYIDNSNTSTPLIYGEFDNNKLTINGNLEVIGPDNGLVRLSNVTTDNTTKASRMVLNHYSNAQSPVYLFGAASTTTDNFVAFGGGNPPSVSAVAATQLDLFTAPNNTTPTGSSRLTIKGDGKIGMGTQTPTHPLQMASGAHVTAGGVWTDASSRDYKENIESLGTEEAITTLAKLDPVRFNYKADATEKHLGFVAEDVPDLVATKDRKGLSPMDIVAVLTKVLQEQQKTISNLTMELKELKRELGR